MNHCDAPWVRRWACSVIGPSSLKDRSTEAGASRVPGIIQRSISRSNTLSDPIQKMANRTLPMTTPAQVCSQAMDLRKVGSIAEVL